jgi:hypothetical protein
MPDFFLAPSLVVFRAEINAEWPDRDKSSDGWIGDPSHAARVSSHNPLWGAPGKWSGVVRAIDVDNDGHLNEYTPLVQSVMHAAIGDPRVWYVIYSRKIYSRTYGWTPHYYDGDNPHDHHVHISLRETIEAWSDTSPWLHDGAPRPTKAPYVDLSRVRTEFRKALGAEPGPKIDRPGVRLIKRALVEDYGFNLKDDGIVGKPTLDAWAYHEHRTGVYGRPQVPDEKSLAALSRGRWSVVS